MAKGFFCVHNKGQSPRDIVFQVTKTEDTPPEDQLLLKAEVERTLVVIQMLFPEDEVMESGASESAMRGNLRQKAKFEQAFNPLLSLAQCGLVGQNAQPEVAKRALVELQNEIVSREAGNVKNRHMRNLGKMALFFAAAISLFQLVMFVSSGWNPLTTFCFLGIGCMAGVWLSFGARKITMGFNDLNIPEGDRLEPSIRLIFAGLLTLLLGLLFFKEAMVVTVGSVTTSAIGHDPVIAAIVGCLAGFSELALPAKVAKQAALFLDQK